MDPVIGKRDWLNCRQGTPAHLTARSKFSPARALRRVKYATPFSNTNFRQSFVHLLFLFASRVAEIGVYMSIRWTCLFGALVRSGYLLSSLQCCAIQNFSDYAWDSWSLLEFVLLARTCSHLVQTHIDLLHVYNKNNLERYGKRLHFDMPNAHRTHHITASWSPRKRFTAVSPLFLELNVEICQAENVRQSGTVHFRLPQSPRRWSDHQGHAVHNFEENLLLRMTTWINITSIESIYMLQRVL